ncbi:DgyrCDS14776 [Dimorphilus gyrociliatus]|uniref:DgyrCDS14776 n=1 Tax=Dimorphilus gyrociliatus TaxID=2664684 RepID=A0A7I8WF73_9ANNE|nr:DgyrCDS14776 [Dimorphilus gyrociliatus]
MKLSSISIKAYVYIIFCRLIVGLKQDRKLINVASKVNGATCQASDEHTPLASFNYRCENVLEPEWVNIDDWAPSCPINACQQKWIDITFKKQYNIAEICFIQRIVSEEFQLTAIEINIDSYSKTYHINIDTDCILLEEGVGLNINIIKFKAKSWNPAAINIGYNTIFAYSYDEDITNTVEDHLINIAGLELGATCEQSNTHINYECTRAIDRVFSHDWASNCGPNNRVGTQDCLNQYIMITFAFPVQPVQYCYSNRFNYPHFVKKMEIEWSSGFIDTLDNLPEDNYYHCFNYTHRPTIEYSVKAIIKEMYTTIDIGFKFFKVFAKKMDGNIYNIQFINDVVYQLPPHLHSYAKSVKFKVKGNSMGNSKDCSSLVISFKNETTKQVELRLDTVLNNIESSSVHVAGEMFEFGSYSSLVNCNKWNHFWLSWSNNEIQFGSGRAYGQNILIRIPSSTPLDIRQILLKNSMEDISNLVQISDKGLYTLYLKMAKNLQTEKRFAEGRNLHSKNCAIEKDYDISDGLLNTCIAIKSQRTTFNYKLMNRKQALLNTSNLVLAFKKTHQLTANFDVYTTYLMEKTGNEKMKECLLEKFIDKTSFLLYYFHCKDLDTSITDVLDIHIFVEKSIDMSKLYFCELFYDD